MLLSIGATTINGRRLSGVIEKTRLFDREWVEGGIPVFVCEMSWQPFFAQ
jgi:hypothetical protein